MAIYYGKLVDGSFGFMDTADFGARTVLVVDPQWRRPTIQIPDPTWQAGAHPGESVPLIEVPDMAAEPPLIEVDNPDCRIPPDACLVTAEQRAAMMVAQGDGKVIVCGVDGCPILTDRPAPTLEQVVAANTTQRNELLAVAAARIAPLQDAVDLGIATDGEQTALLAWKRYRVDISRVDLAAPVWPQSPGT